MKNLKSHDKGRTFSVIRRKLEEELGYSIHTCVIDAGHFVPQHRERIVIVGFRTPVDFSFDALELPAYGARRLKEILHPEDGTEQPEAEFTVGDSAEVNKKYILTDKLWQYLQDYAAKHKSEGQWLRFWSCWP